MDSYKATKVEGNKVDFTTENQTWLEIDEDTELIWNNNNIYNTTY